MNSRQFIMMNGVKQAVNDARAEPVDKKTGKVYTSEEIVAKAAAKLEALYDGSNRVRTESTAADEYEAEAIKEAKRFTIAFLTKKGFMKDIPPKTENRILYAINRYLAAQGKPETTEADYFVAFFAGPNGEAVKARAKKTVDEKRAAIEDMDEELV